MAKVEAKPVRKAGALSQLGALRNRLASASPEFAAAAQLEHDAETFCEKVRTELKTHRLQLGLNQTELAERLGLSQSAISKIENSHGDLNFKTVFRIAAALGLNPVVAFASASHAIADTNAGTAESEQYAATAAALVGAVQEDLIRQIPEIIQGAAARLVAAE